MNTLDIDTCLKTIPDFLGAFPFNELPTKPNGDFSVVINTNADIGEHWLALVRKDKETQNLRKHKIYFYITYNNQ